MRGAAASSSKRKTGRYETGRLLVLCVCVAYLSVSEDVRSPPIAVDTSWSVCAYDAYFVV